MRGARIAVTAHRRAADLAGLLERRGAEVMVGATLGGDVPASDDEIAADTAAVLDAEPSWLIATTGVGMRMWSQAADRCGQGDALRTLAQRARCVARGAKAEGGLAVLGARADWTSPNNTDRDVATWLASRVMPSDTIVVQLHGGHPTAYADLQDRVDMMTVMPYRWELPEDPGPADALIDAILDGSIDVVTFTSVGAVQNLFVLAGRRDAATAADLRRALAGDVAVAAVGPVTAEAVENEGGIVTVVPRRWRTADMVRAIESWWARRHASDAVGGLRLAPSRSALLLGDAEVELGPREFAVLAALSRRAGVMIPTDELVIEAWGHAAPSDGTLVKHQIARLRRKLDGTGVVIETVRGVGYRLRGVA